MAIKCCKGCVPPKRHTACWGHCPEYIEEKAEEDRKKAQHNKQSDISGAIYAERSKKVYNALKGYRGNKYRER